MTEWSARWPLWVHNGTLQLSNPKSEVEVWIRKSEVGSRKSEVWSLKSEVWSLKSEVWSLRSEVWSLNSEVWSLKAEVGSRKSKVGSRMSEVWSLKSARLFESRSRILLYQSCRLTPLDKLDKSWQRASQPATQVLGLKLVSPASPLTCQSGRSTE